MKRLLLLAALAALLAPAGGCANGPCSRLFDCCGFFRDRCDPCETYYACDPCAACNPCGTCNPCAACQTCEPCANCGTGYVQGAVPQGVVPRTFAPNATVEPTPGPN